MSKKKNNNKHQESCTFCGRPYNMVKKLIAGQGDVFICNDCVQLCTSILEQEDISESKSSSSKFDETIPAPATIKAELDSYVIGQERAKKVLSVAVHNHYKRLYNQKDMSSEVELEKSNVLLLGPTGCGKTLMAKILAKFVGVPFAIADATTLTEAGYVGEDVENILLRLIQAADGDISLAQRGIIYVDEIDKIGGRTQNVSITRDVSGEGVQQALLKMLEGTTCNVPPQGGRKHPEQKYLQIDTTNILFICGGAFNGIDEIVSQRVGQKSIGFHREDVTAEEELSNLLAQVCHDDLLEFGLVPEFIGRLPVLTTINPLDEKALISVLTEPKNALIKQYQHLFAMEDNSHLEFTEDALHYIASKSMEKKTGARALRGIIEENLIDLMFDLPDLQKPISIKITKDLLIQGWESYMQENKKDFPKIKRNKNQSKKEKRESA